MQFGVKASGTAKESNAATANLEDLPRHQRNELLQQLSAVVGLRSLGLHGCNGECSRHSCRPRLAANASKPTVRPIVASHSTCMNAPSGGTALRPVWWANRCTVAPSATPLSRPTEAHQSEREPRSQKSSNPSAHARAAASGTGLSKKLATQSAATPARMLNIRPPMAFITRRISRLLTPALRRAQQQAQRRCCSVQT